MDPDLVSAPRSRSSARRRLHISVVIPTFRRPETLRRAVESVRAQDYDGWDLVISDDDGAGIAEEVVGSDDPRIVVVENEGPHGQVGNLRNALAHARGDWVKPLYDDDALAPGCLAAMADAIGRDPDAAMVRCLARHVVEGRPPRPDRPGGRARVERLTGRAARRALVLHDEDIGIPSQVAVNRAVIDTGILPEDVTGLTSGVDTWWYARILGRGDLVLLNEVLVDRHQGEHDTVTSGLSASELDEEFELLTRLIWPLMGDPAATLFGMSQDDVVKGVRTIRSLHRLSSHQPGEALRLARSGAGLRSWALAGRWGLRRTFPGRFERIPRENLGHRPE